MNKEIYSKYVDKVNYFIKIAKKTNNTKLIGLLGGLLEKENIRRFSPILAFPKKKKTQIPILTPISSPSTPSSEALSGTPPITPSKRTKKTIDLQPDPAPIEPTISKDDKEQEDLLKPFIGDTENYEDAPPSATTRIKDPFAKHRIPWKELQSPTKTTPRTEPILQEIPGEKKKEIKKHPSVKKETEWEPSYSDSPIEKVELMPSDIDELLAKTTPAINEEEDNEEIEAKKQQLSLEEEFRTAYENKNLKQQDLIMATLFIKYVRDLANIAVSYFISIPGSLREWVDPSHVNMPEFMVERFYYPAGFNVKSALEEINRSDTPEEEKKTLRRYLSNYYKHHMCGENIREKIRSGRKSISSDEVPNNIYTEEIVDRIFDVIFYHPSGIYLGNVKELQQYMLDPKNQSERFINKSKYKKDNRSPMHYLRENSIPVDPSTFEGRFVQGLGTLVFQVAAQQILERWGPIKRDKETNVNIYRHVKNEPHPLEMISYDHPGGFDRGLRNIEHFDPGQNKRHDINLEEDIEHIFKKEFDVPESGQQAFDQLYDIRINKFDKESLGQFITAEAAFISKTIAENINKLFSKQITEFDSKSNDETLTIKSNKQALRLLMAFYLNTKASLETERQQSRPTDEGFTLPEVEEIKVPVDVMRKLRIPFDEKYIVEEQIMKSDKSGVAYSWEYIIIRPFGAHGTAQKLWERSKRYIINQHVIDQYIEIMNHIQATHDAKQEHKFNRVLVNYINRDLKKVLDDKVQELIKLRQESKGKRKPFQQPAWNANKGAEEAEIAIYLQYLSSEKEMLALEIEQTLKKFVPEETKRLFSK